MLDIRNLQFHYPDQASQQGWQFSLSVAEGECVALNGPSGCGKTTLLNLIAGFLAPDGGTLTWQGRSLVSLLPWQRPVTTVFQDQNLFEHLTVGDNIGLGLHPGLKLTGRQWNQIEQTLAEVNLGGFRQRYPGSLSGGQRQRVALVRALLRPQPLLLLDEPMSGLDADNRTRMYALLEQARQQGKTLLLVSHDGQDRSRLADREEEAFFQSVDG